VAKTASEGKVEGGINPAKGELDEAKGNAQTDADQEQGLA
jgi:hypothetical protein